MTIWLYSKNWQNLTIGYQESSATKPTPLKTAIHPHFLWHIKKNIETWTLKQTSIPSVKSQIRRPRPSKAGAAPGTTGGVDPVFLEPLPRPTLRRSNGFF